MIQPKLKWFVFDYLLLVHCVHSAGSRFLICVTSPHIQQPWPPSHGRVKIHHPRNSDVTWQFEEWGVVNPAMKHTHTQFYPLALRFFIIHLRRQGSFSFPYALFWLHWCREELIYVPMKYMSLQIAYVYIWSIHLLIPRNSSSMESSKNIVLSVYNHIIIIYYCKHCHGHCYHAQYHYHIPRYIYIY